MGIHRFNRKKVSKIAIYAAAIFITLLIIFPVIYMIPYAWKGKAEYSTLENFTWLPEKWVWQNFTQIFKVNVNGGTFLRSLWMTLLVACCGTVLVLFINIVSGYGFARYDFPGKKILFACVVFTMFIPGITTMLTSIKLCNQLGMTNTIWVLFIPGVANGYNIFFFRQYYMNFPSEMEEAAMLDGCNDVQIFSRIYLPLSATPIVIIGIGSFMGHWNNYLWATLTITQNEEWYTQVMQIVKGLQGQTASRYGFGVVIAATIISLIIPFTLYAVFNKKIIQGITLTGMK